jgi:hypothetical protein
MKDPQVQEQSHFSLGIAEVLSERCYVPRPAAKRYRLSSVRHARRKPKSDLRAGHLLSPAREGTPEVQKQTHWESRRPKLKNKNKATAYDRRT